MQADIRATTDVAWEWTFEDLADAQDILCWIWTPPTGVGVRVSWDATEEDAAVYLADEWSEHVCHTLAKTDAELARHWPPCPSPGHDHALDPELRNDRAVWVCRDDGNVIVSVGELGNR